MKSLSLFALLSLTISPALLAQDPVYTTPVGYVSRELTQGVNLFGLTVHTPTLASGSVDSVNSNTITDAALSFTPTAGKTYIFEVTSGTLNGVIQELTSASFSGTTITVTDNLASLGLQAGDLYSIRVAPTLEDIFTTVPQISGGILGAALSSPSADIVWLPNGAGGYNRYYLRSGATPEFRNVDTNLASPNVPVVYSDAMFIQKKGITPVTLTVSGEIKTTKTNSVAVQGINVFSSVVPSGLNLFNAGLETNLQAALSAPSADIVWVQQPNLSYIKYFRRSGTGAGWRVEGSTTTLTDLEAAAVSLDNGFLIQRKGITPINISLNVPAGFENF